MYNTVENNIKLIMDHTRLMHTKDCIKYNFQHILSKIQYINFRDINATIKDDVDKEFNINAIDEHNELIKYNNYHIYWLANAIFWFYFCLLFS